MNLAFERSAGPAAWVIHVDEVRSGAVPWNVKESGVFHFLSFLSFVFFVVKDRSNIRERLLEPGAFHGSDGELWWTGLRVGNRNPLLLSA